MVELNLIEAVRCAMARAMRGVDLESLAEQTGRPVYSWAQNGGGFYHTLVFSERVPDDSIAVLDRVLDIEAGHGPATQFRNKLRKEREAAGG